MEHMNYSIREGANFEDIVLISSNMIVRGVLIDGQLQRAIGELVEAEVVEMNHVKVKFRNGQEDYFELGENVKWIEVEL